MWRRGTVPLWWGQEIKNTVGEAEIFIQDNPFSGVSKYYQRLQVTPGRIGGGVEVKAGAFPPRVSPCSDVRLLRFGGRSAHETPRTWVNSIVKGPFSVAPC